MFVITSAFSPLGRRVFAKFNQLGINTGAMLHAVDATAFTSRAAADHVLNWASTHGDMLTCIVGYQWKVEEVQS